MVARTRGGSRLRRSPGTRSLPDDGRSRVVIAAVSPEIDCGAYAIKRVPGETVRVVATIFADGHDQVAAVLKHRQRHEDTWSEVPMRALPNDRWVAEFAAARPYTRRMYPS